MLSEIMVGNLCGKAVVKSLLLLNRGLSVPLMGYELIFLLVERSAHLRSVADSITTGDLAVLGFLRGGIIFQHLVTAYTTLVLKILHEPLAPLDSYAFYAGGIM